ncbi:oligopeptide transporter 2 [Coleophoma crateriformis]|uniref:Oligopeptide transporter 2 n=1 Tax=Coleophoma crateriformis TaxID=565419 RepID=A0A3D8RE91_9HELO|nr:oligopeptide transporter 2 [Coleophoma crateriformis]
MSEKYPVDEKVVNVNEKNLDRYDSPAPSDRWIPPEEWLERLIADYSGQHGGNSETLPPGTDPHRMAVSVLTFSEEESVKILEAFVIDHSDDYSIDRAFLARGAELAKGHTACDMEEGEWAYVTCKTAGLINNWSPYAEVRAVTIPYDDPDEPCESFRAYLIGMFWVCVATAVNTFFSPRQPGISIPGGLIQLFCVPMGRGLAYILPDWGFTIRGTRYTLNPGPWSAKEQLLATIISQADTIGNFTGLLDMRLPAFFGQRWVGYGFCIMLAFANQIYGLGAAGILRRLSVYPQQAVWPAVLPTLALNRTLIYSDNRREVINGWKMTRYICFALFTVIFILYYWLPNELFEAIRLFNWMTWIAPKNFNLAVITGSYGGMGYNPWSSFDPNTSGSSTMSSPFFAQLQQYVMRAISGIIIIIMYYSNTSWGSYMPINSNTAFANTGVAYNVSQVLTPDNKVNIDAYKTYGPPYYSVSNLYVTGACYVYYTFSIVYVFIRYWRPLRKAFVGIVLNTWHRRSIYTGFEDGQTRMMRKYKEVPEWWYSLVFLFGFIISIVSVVAWPTQTPWWSICVVTGVGALLTIPWVIIESIAATGISTGTIWQVLPGIIWPGNPMAQLVMLMLGGAFEDMAGSFTQDLKYAHYAKLPPRAVWRGHITSCFINCIVYCGILELMVVYFNQDSTLCEWNNKEHMVCSYANSVYSSTISFGAFGTNNMFKLYPVLPWCFLIGAVLGLFWVLSEKWVPRIRDVCKARMEGERFAWFDHYIWKPAATTMACLHPAIALSGAQSWSGNTNLTYGTLGIYLAWVFQYYLKRRYTAWWGKYAYMIFAGLSVGVAISGLIVTLVFSFGAGKNASLNWWGNSVLTAGVDYELYNNEVALQAIPEVGYFGLSPDQFPLNW